ncbi:hypothetical protein WMW72_23660 [Paenibacillus filicis]|uniref:Uncharacterized protein n=1 Tax=Paenibacillus filicis TaxID=669464 RepID=A0ABU9DPX9_9BACL
MAEYRLKGEQGEIRWGELIEFETVEAELRKRRPLHAGENPSGVWEWTLEEGVYRAQDIVREVGTLLAAVIAQLGGAGDSAELLLDNVQASLALSGREAVLPLGTLAFGDAARLELSRQAQTIGEGVTRWAREFSSGRRALIRYGEEALQRLVQRSRCDSHLWTPQVVDLLTGPAGGPVVMQLFNEYLHQLILLRDALLPFENWEEVAIEIKHSGPGKGLRFLEQAREQFLSILLVKKVPHRDIVRLAQSLLNPELTAVGYGFQYRLGTVLPAGLGRSPVQAPKYLLRWHPVLTVGSPSPESGGAPSVAFVYEEEDYYAAERSPIGEGEPFEPGATGTELAGIQEAVITSHPADSAGQATLQYRLHAESGEFAVDLGQIARGHRYLYVPQPLPSTAGSEDDADLRSHGALDVLALPGLVTGESGIHGISAGGNPLLVWALLGKLYPENVILLAQSHPHDLEAAKRSGKSFGAKFLLIEA